MGKGKGKKSNLEPGKTRRKRNKRNKDYLDFTDITTRSGTNIYDTPDGMKALRKSLFG